ncbi:MAG: ferrochelatase [Kiritimatiellia bacterium]
MPEAYDAVMLTSFGGPEGPSDVMPFLDNVLRGRNIPHERKVEVAHHYDRFGGVSPINAQNRELRRLLEDELRRRGHAMKVYWGNRNWNPYIPETLEQMRRDGVRRFLAYVTSAFSSYSGCRQYRENLDDALAAMGEGAPAYGKIRVFYNHPDFIGLNRRNVAAALARIPAERRASTRIAFTAHSIPDAMAATSKYLDQLEESCRLVAAAPGGAPDWKLVFQSRSGPPTQPWTGPDILEHLRGLKEQGATDVVISPIGFVSDHMEVLFDLDVEAKELCADIGLNMVRAATPGNDPLFVSMLAELVGERLVDNPVRRSLGDRGPSHDVCPEGCCRYERPAGGRPAHTRG